MKNLYILLVLPALTATNDAFGQAERIHTVNDAPKTLQMKRDKLASFVGFSVAVPLFKHYKLDRQQRKLLTLPVSPSATAFISGIRIVTATEDGPIAWSYTGDAVTVYVPRYIPPNAGGGGGGYGGSSGGGNPDGPPPVQMAIDHGPISDNSYFDYNYPRPIVNARKVPKNYCQNGKTVFKSMWDRQAQVGKEQIAFVTDKGTFWLDDTWNTSTFSETGFAYEYPGLSGQKFFIVNGEAYTIQSIVHTHPNNTDLSQKDMDLARTFGVPIYAIAPTGVSKGMPNGSAGIVDYNRDNAFDCGIATGLFGL